MNRKQSIIIKWGGIAFLALTLVYWLYRAFLFQIHDFSNAYVASFFLRNELFDPGVYDALLFNEEALKNGFKGLFLAYYPNTPFLAFFFYPFSFLDIASAKNLFNVGSIILLLLGLLRLQKQIAFLSRLYFFIPFLFFNSLRSGLYFGQVYFLVFFLLVMGTEAYSKNQAVKGAFYWGIALLLKVFPVLLGGLLITQKRYKGVVAYGVVVLVGLFCSLVLVDSSTWMYYLLDVLPQTSAGNYYNGFSSEAQSATMLFKHCFISDGLLNPNPIYKSYKMYLFIDALYKTSVLGAILLFSWRSRHNYFVLMGGWIIATILLSPGLSSYAGVLLLFPWLVIWQKDTNTSLLYRLFFSLWIAVYINLPSRCYINLPLIFSFPKLYLLGLIFAQYLVGLKEATGNKKEQIGFVVVLFCFFTTLNLFKKNVVQNQYAIQEEAHILISDYLVQDEVLVYEYWTIPEPKYIKTTIPIQAIDTTVVAIKNNQIYYQNKCLTNDNSRKRKPMLVNENEVFYLSDQNRGIGFYTLMKVTVNKELR